MRARRLGCGILLAAGSAAATLVVIEAALRLFAPQALLRDPDAFDPDPVLGVRLKPGFSDRVIGPDYASTWIINADGHRGPRAGARGDPGRRVVALGDSFTFGYGVEEEQAWPRLLESLLNQGKLDDHRVEVLNLGVGGYGTWQEERWLSQVCEKLGPDLALVAFYAGNDPVDNQKASIKEAASQSPGADPGEVGQPPRAEAVKRWLGSRLHIYRLLSQRNEELFVRLGLRQIVYPFEMEVLLKEEPPQVRDAWGATAVAFRRLADLARARGLRVVLVLVPMKHQVSDSVWEWLVKFYGRGMKPEAFDRKRPQAVARRLAERAGMEVIDLLDGLRASGGPQEGDPKDLYFPRDQHWTERGHAEAARLIAGYLNGPR